jgi:PAS domain S-box-containing protein
MTDENSSMNKPRIIESGAFAAPAKCFVAVLLVVVLAEMMVMVMFDTLPFPIDHQLLDLVDGLLLALIAAPVLHFLLYRPLVAQIALSSSMARELTRREEEVRLARSDWEKTFDSIEDLVTIHDPSFTVLQSNRKTLETLNPQTFVPGAEVKCFNMFHGKTAPCSTCPMVLTLADGEPHRSEFFEPLLERYLEVRTNPRLDDAGHVESVIHIVRDVTEAKQQEAKLRLDAIRFENLYELATMIDASETDIKDFALEASLQVTGSSIGYLYFMDREEQTLTLHAWSRNVMKECRTATQPTVYRVDETGLWGEAVRQRRPVITNDYAAPDPLKKGYPEGHVPLRRHMNLPILDDDRIVLIAGVGNKELPYDGDDVQHLNLVMDAMWRLLQRKSAKREMRESESRYRHLFTSMLDGFALHEMVVAPDGRPTDYRFLEVNPSFERLTGLHREDIIGRTVTEVMPDTEPHWIERYGRVAESGEPLHLVSYSAVLGKWFEISAYSPGVGQFATTFNDVSERKRYEDALHNIATGVAAATGAEFFTSLATHLATALEVEYVMISELERRRHDTATTLAFFAHGAIRENLTYGLDGTPCANVAQQGLCTFERGVRGLFPRDHDLVAMEAESYAGIPLADSHGDIVGLMVVIGTHPMVDRSFTEMLLQIFAIRAAAELERLRLDKSRREHEKLLNTIIETEPECVKLLARDGTLIKMNRSGLKMIDADSLDQVRGQSLSDLVLPEYRGAFMSLTEQVFRGEEATLVFEASGLKGRRLWLDTHAVPMRDERGEIISLLAITRDITASRQALEALRKSEEHIRQIFIQDDDALLFLHSDTFEIIDANPVALSMFGLDPGKLSQMTPRVFMGKDDFRRFVAAVNTESNSRVAIVDGVTCNGGDGGKIIASIRVQKLDLADRDVVFCSLRDMTDKARLMEEVRLTQAKLIQANKMSSLGLLVSGVAHEINNPNQCIAINVRLLQSVWNELLPVLDEVRQREGEIMVGGEPFPAVREMAPRLFEGISDGSSRIAAIVENMKEYARGDKGGMKNLFEVNAAVNGALGIIRHNLNRYTRHFRVDLGEGLPPVRGNRHQLEQVIINLVMNSLQALPDPDRGVAIATANDQEAGWAVISVTDEGRGMPPAVVRRLTEPFFTTRENQGGTGLGLYISSSIVNDHGGALEFKSEKGKGTTAIIRLPTAAAVQNDTR